MCSHLSIEWRVPFDNGERITNYRLFMKKKDESEKKEKKGMYFKNKPMGKRGQMQPDNSDVKWTEAEVLHLATAPEAFSRCCV